MNQEDDRILDSFFLHVQKSLGSRNSGLRGYGWDSDIGCWAHEALETAVFVMFFLGFHGRFTGKIAGCRM